MIDLIRDLLDRPLDPRHTRAVLALASCLTIAFAVLAGLGVTVGSSRPSPTGTRLGRSPIGPPSAPPPASTGGSAQRQGDGPSAAPSPRQDPQDRRGSPAYQRVHRAMRGHLALQHLPFRRRGLSITLVGADRGRALIQVVASTQAEARRDWRRYLRSVGDPGDSYLPRFHARGRRHGR